MAKQTIEIDIPDRYEFVRFGQCQKPDEYYLDANGEVQRYGAVAGINYIIVRPIERWRVPKKLDLLNRDSIECRYRQSWNAGAWQSGSLYAITKSDDFQPFYICEKNLWVQQCEIRDTEPKPRECWRLFDGAKFWQTCDGIEAAMHLASTNGWHLVHFVEVPE